MNNGAFRFCHWIGGSGKTTGETPMNEAQAVTTVKCARCHQAVEKPIYHTIYFIGFDSRRGKRASMSENLPFCSAEHASHEQMSREG